MALSGFSLFFTVQKQTKILVATAEAAAGAAAAAAEAATVFGGTTAWGNNKRNGTSRPLGSSFVVVVVIVVVVVVVAVHCVLVVAVRCRCPLSLSVVVFRSLRRPFVWPLALYPRRCSLSLYCCLALAAAAAVYRM